jgi:hypothetical protein
MQVSGQRPPPLYRRVEVRVPLNRRLGRSQSQTRCFEGRITSPIPAGIQTRDCLARSPVAVPSIFFPVFLALVVGFRYNVFCVVTLLVAIKSRYRGSILAPSFYNGYRAH